MKQTLSFPLRLLWFSAVLCACFLSCGSPEKPVTAEEARAFGKKLEQSIEKRDPAFFNEAMDRSELTRRAGLSGSRQEKEFAAGVRNAIHMGTKIVDGISKEATYQLVKQYEKEGKHHLIFRLFDDGSINYHDLELIRRKNDVKVADMMVYTTGENLSATISGLYKQFSGVIDASTGKEDWLQSMPRIREEMKKGHHDKAYDLFLRIPEEGRKSKAFRMLKIEICSGLGDEEQQKAINEMISAFPNEPNMQLILLDYYFLKKEYSKVLDAINAVDRMIDKDPFLDYYRYLCYNIMEDEAKAKEHLLRVCRNYPKFPDARLELVATYLNEDKPDSARIQVKEYRLIKTFPQSRLDNLLGAYPGFDENETTQ